MGIYNLNGYASKVPLGLFLEKRVGLVEIKEDQPFFSYHSVLFELLEMSTYHVLLKKLKLLRNLLVNILVQSVCWRGI